MPKTLTIIAQIWAKEGKSDFVKNELLKLNKPTKAEKGCINYDLHQDNENPNLFLYFENWENRNLWQAHMKSDHSDAFSKATEGAIEKVVLNEMTLIS